MKRRQKKGQAVLISHAILIGISVAMVLVVVYTFNSIKKDYQEFIATNDIEQACFILKTGIEKVYTENDYRSPTGTTYGSIRIVLPDKLADLKYRTSFANRTVYLDTVGSIIVNTSCKIGLNVSFSGFTTGGVTEITYTELANGSRIINFERIS